MNDLNMKTSKTSNGLRIFFRVLKKVGIFLLSLFLFFWFFLRPSMIKSDCADETSKFIRSKLYEQHYQNCLRRNGL